MFKLRRNRLRVTAVAIAALAVPLVISAVPASAAPSGTDRAVRAPLAGGKGGHGPHDSPGGMPGIPSGLSPAWCPLPPASGARATPAVPDGAALAGTADMASGTASAAMATAVTRNLFLRSLNITTCLSLVRGHC